jgi:hypothetical protein
VNLQDAAHFSEIGSFLIALFLGLLEATSRLKKMKNWKSIGFIIFLTLGLISAALTHILPNTKAGGFVDIAPSNSVFGVNFKNEEVLLDGSAFSHCTFDIVTFIYNGDRPFGIADCKVDGPYVFRVPKPEFGPLLLFMKHMGVMDTNHADFVPIRKK